MSRDDAYGAEEEMTPDARKFMEAAARELPEQPDPRLEADLVSRLAATAAEGAPTAPMKKVSRRPRFGIPARRLPLRVALVAGALTVSTAGLAVAGVKLPGPVDDGFSKVGIDLPNQAKDSPDGSPAPGAVEESGDGDAANPGVADPQKGKGPDGRKGGHSGRGKGKPGSPGASGTAPGQTKPGGGKPSAPGQTKPKGQSARPKPAKPSKPAKPAKPPKPVRPASGNQDAGGSKK
jgi:hypothetical protein